MDASITYLVKAPRTSELVVWLKFNDINPYAVPTPSDIFVESDADGRWWIRHSAYVRSACGAVTYDARVRSYAYVERREPLVYDPPMHWLTELVAS